MRGRAWLAKLTVASFGVAVAVAVGELVVRVFPPLARRAAALRPVAERRVEVHPRGLYRMDGESCWTLTPGFTGRFVRPAFDIEVRANRLGLRDREPGAKGPGTLRILGLGDSFAFGWGVPLEASFFKRLEPLLDDSHPDVTHEVVNAGIPGYGTYEALRLLPSVGLGYEPDLVILAFYEGNDYLNNGEAPRRRAVVDGYLTDLKAGGCGGLARLALRHSALVTLVADQWSRLGEKRAHRASVERTKALLSEMRTVLAAPPAPHRPAPARRGRLPAARRDGRILPGAGDRLLPPLGPV